MELLPIFLNIRDRKCVIVGGGEIAFRKASLLCRAGARLHIQAEQVSDEMRALCDANGFTVSVAAYSSECLEDATLVVAATDDLAVNTAVSVDAKLNNIPVNVVDQPSLCTFIVPSIVDRSPIVIAISSSGSSPVLIRKLKELNESLVPGNIGELATLFKSYRQRVKDKFSSFDDRLRFWEQVVDSEVAELVYSGQTENAKAKMDSQLEEGVGNSKQGEVYLVGAGPGDPDLLTLKALRLMHKADVVLYDRLVSKQILQKIRADAEKIYVGKQRSDHSVEQEGINQMLVRLAKEGKRVLRLKGGDPFIFGRGGEELESLAKESIPFQVVPGITAASGCAAYAGIPLTHRDYAQSVRFLTGHLKNGSLEMNWDDLISEQETLVFYMGLLALPTICEGLIKHGMSKDMPIALVEQGTRLDQRTIKATLGTIVAKSNLGNYVSPSLIIIGRVVELRDSLAWRD
jgi:uroporphyrin-III C-methyltransferase/precorrin-2 dehydrogenase/sirohydrochlorin ferrochelatase